MEHLPHGALAAPDRGTRAQRMRADGAPLPLPPVTTAAYLIDHLLDIGPYMPGAMGLAPLTHGEIAAWQANTGIELQAWEARMLRHLSAAYVAEARSAERPDAAPPWSATHLDDDARANLSRRLGAALSARARPA